MYAIEAKGLVKQFDGFRAVDGVDLKIPEGSIFGILGPNGAGKTTMLRTLLGIIDPDAGTRSLLGSDRPITQSRNVGYLPEERGLYQSMRAVDTIAFMGGLRLNRLCGITPSRLSARPCLRYCCCDWVCIFSRKT
jgi:ABC-2 type transport system ATP-binding protein